MEEGGREGGWGIFWGVGKKNVGHTHIHARTHTSQAPARRTSDGTTGVVEAKGEREGVGCRGGRQGTANSHAQRTGMAGVARRRARRQPYLGLQR